ncbi:aquaporin-11 [Chanos chanos]|uniref:Aquaporin n=1 Tax=Chanos chanos TaxID=29144 RepID=A0A6J2URQ4_CHACN|nr:aquaporin-11 [Chanos chanos]
MADISVSLSLLVGIVLLSEITRRTVLKLFARTDYGIYLVEFVSSFQLYACTHELKMLGEVGRIEPQIGLTLTYLISVVHGLTFHGAVGNPSGTLEHVYRRRFSGRCALGRIICQFLAAIVARALAPYIWALGLSDLHIRHKLFGFKCISPIRDPLLKAAVVELGCAFAVHTATAHMQGVDDKYRVHAIAALITTLVYAAGSLTGAVFNPALAFSTQFPCSGNTFAEYTFVYWLGPILGMVCSLLLHDGIFPHLSGKRTYRKDLNFNANKRKKIK